MVHGNQNMITTVSEPFSVERTVKPSYLTVTVPSKYDLYKSLEWAIRRNESLEDRKVHACPHWSIRDRSFVHVLHKSSIGAQCLIRTCFARMIRIPADRSHITDISKLYPIDRSHISLHHWFVPPRIARMLIRAMCERLGTEKRIQKVGIAPIDSSDGAANIFEFKSWRQDFEVPTQGIKSHVIAPPAYLMFVYWTNPTASIIHLHPRRTDVDWIGGLECGIDGDLIG